MLWRDDDYWRGMIHQGPLVVAGKVFWVKFSLFSYTGGAAQEVKVTADKFRNWPPLFRNDTAWRPAVLDRVKMPSLRTRDFTSSCFRVLPT